MIVQVGNPNDPRIAPYGRVSDAKWLKTAGLFVAEGRLVVERLIASRRFRLHSVLVTQAALQSLESGAGLEAPIFVAEREVISRVAGFDFHRGCLALAERPPETPSPELDAGRRILALEGVADPSNVGGLFRVAAAFGVDGVLLDPATADPFYRKAVRTSMGAVLHLPFARLAPWPQSIADYKARGFRVLALTPRADAPHLADVPRSQAGPVIVLVGAEGPGLSGAAMELADILVRIPTSAAVDSLNVSVAAGIVLAHLAG
jgi:tRNA G18 (ribose-2'-O)-methylase SpoU